MARIPITARRDWLRIVLPDNFVLPDILEVFRFEVYQESWAIVAVQEDPESCSAASPLTEIASITSSNDVYFQVKHRGVEVKR